MSGPDVESGSRFVAYYFSRLSLGMKTGDTAGAESLARPSCETCRSVVKRIKAIYETGGHFTTQGVRAEDIVAAPRQDPAHRTYALTMHQFPGRLFDEGGRFVERQPGSRELMQIVLARTPTGWLVQRLDLLR